MRKVYHENAVRAAHKRIPGKIRKNFPGIRNLRVSPPSKEHHFGGGLYCSYMMTRHEHGKMTWVDLESPTREELENVMREFDIDSSIQEEIIVPTPYPIEVSFQNYSYLVLHFPTADPEGGIRTQEIDFIAGKNFLLTVRYDVIESLHNLHKIFKAEELLDLPVAHADILLERLLRRVYNAIGEEVEQVAYKLDRIERAIFSGKERETVRVISNVTRVLLRFETTLKRHEEPLKAFLADLSSPSLFGKHFEEHFAHIEAERSHVTSLVTSYRAVATELRNTNNSLLTASQNEIVKILTVMAFIAFPLSLVGTIFGMNVQHAPIVGQPHDFWIILGIMLIAGICFYTFFRIKRWL